MKRVQILISFVLAIAVLCSSITLAESYKDVTNQNQFNCYTIRFNTSNAPYSLMPGNQIHNALNEADAFSYLHNISLQYPELPQLDVALINILSERLGEGEIESFSVYLPESGNARASTTETFGSYGGYLFKQVFTVTNPKKISEKKTSVAKQIDWVKGVIDLAMCFVKPYISVPYALVGQIKPNAQDYIVNGDYTLGVITQEITDRVVYIEDLKGIGGGATWYPILYDQARIASVVVTFYPSSPLLNAKLYQSPEKTVSTKNFYNASAIRKECYDFYRTASGGAEIRRSLKKPTIEWI